MDSYFCCFLWSSIISLWWFVLLNLQGKSTSSTNSPFRRLSALNQWMHWKLHLPVSGGCSEVDRSTGIVRPRVVACGIPVQSLHRWGSWTLLLFQDLIGVHLEMTTQEIQCNKERCIRCLQLSPRDWDSQKSERKNLRQQGAKIIELSQVESLAIENVSVVLHPCQAALLGGAFISTGFALLKAHTQTLPFLPRDWSSPKWCSMCQHVLQRPVEGW